MDQIKEAMIRDEDENGPAHMMPFLARLRATANGDPRILQAVDEIERLKASLRRMTAAFHPFTLKPIGADGSAARAEQDEQIAAHREAVALSSAERNADT